MELYIELSAPKRLAKSLTKHLVQEDLVNREHANIMFTLYLHVNGYHLHVCSYAYMKVVVAFVIVIFFGLRAITWHHEVFFGRN